MHGAGRQLEMVLVPLHDVHRQAGAGEQRVVAHRRPAGEPDEAELAAFPFVNPARRVPGR
jgi:hypothetical protein